jgi:hypothetical protein
MVARYCDVNNATGCDVVGEENGGEFDLDLVELALVKGTSVRVITISRDVVYPRMGGPWIKGVFGRG